MTFIFAPLLTAPLVWVLKRFAGPALCVYLWLLFVSFQLLGAQRAHV